MATQTIEFSYTTGQTLTGKLFAIGSDTQVDSQSATEATNRKSIYTVAFTDVAAGDYLFVVFSGSTGVASGYVTLTLTTVTFQVRNSYRSDLVNAPNATAVTAIQNGLSTFDATTDEVTPSNAEDTTAIREVTDKLNDTLEDDGGTQRFTANALEQGPSGAGSSLTGANAVTITVDDGTDPLEDARVRVTKGALTEVKATNASGVAEFSLDDGTWTIVITLANYTFTSTTLVVSGDATPTYSMTRTTPTPAPDGAVSVYLIVRSLSTKAPVSGHDVTLTLASSPPGAGHAVIGGSVTVPSNGSGEAWFNVIPGEKYQAALPNGGTQEITIPATVTDGDPMASIWIE